MSFDGIAPHYDWMETVLAGRRLERARAAHLDALAGRRHVLSAGEGHGRFAEACLKRHPGIRLTSVDASERMLARARRRVLAHLGADAAKRTEWLHATLPGWEGTGAKPTGCDAIATCFFLDCFPPRILEQVIASLAGAVEHDAVWLVVDFAVPEGRLARWRALAIHALMYAFFRVATRLPARRFTVPDAALQAQGFRRAARTDFEWGLIRSEVWRRGA